MFKIEKKEQQCKHGNWKQNQRDAVRELGDFLLKTKTLVKKLEGNCNDQHLQQCFVLHHSWPHLARNAERDLPLKARGDPDRPTARKVSWNPKVKYF